MAPFIARNRVSGIHVTTTEGLRRLLKSFGKQNRTVLDRVLLYKAADLKVNEMYIKFTKSVRAVKKKVEVTVVLVLYIRMCTHIVSITNLLGILICTHYFMQRYGNIIFTF